MNRKYLSKDLNKSDEELFQEGNITVDKKMGIYFRRKKTSRKNIKYK